MADRRYRLAPSSLGWGRILWSFALGSTMLLRVLAPGEAFGRDPGRGPPSDTGPPADPPGALDSGQPPATADPPRQTSSDSPDDSWHHNLIRERTVEVRLRSARNELAAGRVAEGLDLLQGILDRDEDLFVRFDDRPVPSGAHSLAEELLRSLSPEALGIYETLYGSEARRLLLAARAKNDPRLLTAVVRRFFHAAAGFEAAVALAHHRLDRGASEPAAALWSRLLESPTHDHRIRPQHLAAAALSYLRAGREAEYRSLKSRLAGEKLQFGGKHVSADKWFARHVAMADHPGVDGAHLGGGPDRNGAFPGSIPALQAVRWSIPLAGERSGHIAALATRWEQWQQQQGLPIGAAHAPIVSGTRLIFRDYEGVRAVDLASGVERWFYPTASALATEIAPRPGAATEPVVEGNPDPSNSMRHLVGNSLLGTLAANDRLVFVLDRVESASPTQTASIATSEGSVAPRRQSNLLLALAIDPQTTDAEGIPPLWSVGGFDSAEGGDVVLAGHYFVGPPLPVGDRLFAVSEYRQQLHLSCLESATGNLVWTQSICSVTQPIIGDHHRQSLICTPSYGDGVLVCPTQAGVLVAVDAQTGCLLWASPCDDAEPQSRQQMAVSPYSLRRRFGHTGFVNLPVIQSGRVVYLPAHSEHVHCFDLRTGRSQWRVRRNELEFSSATEYVAASENGVVLLVGRSRSRGLDLASGAERFQVRLGSPPAGRGVRLKSGYLIPLEDGRAVSLAVSTGRTTGAAPSCGNRSLGNLVVAGGLVISMGRTSLTAWPQAEVELVRLQAELARNSTTEMQLAAAELELSLNRVNDARQRLERLSKPLDGRASAFASRLARDVVLTQLTHGSADVAPLLQRLAIFSEAPDDRIRWLLERARAERAAERYDDLAQTARELCAASPQMLLPLLDDPARFVQPVDFAAALLPHRSRAAGTIPRVTPAIALQTTDTSAESLDLPELWQGLALATEPSEADRLRLQLADRLMTQGESQQAELLLVECRRSHSEELAAAATARLVDLWEQRSLHHPAALLLEELPSRFADVELGSRTTGLQYVSQRRHEGPAWQAFRQLGQPSWSGAGVRISESAAPDETLQTLYNGNNTQMLVTPRAIPFDLFDKGRGIAGQLCLVDRYTGRECPETIQLPGRFRPPVSHQPGHVHHSFVGHFLPIGGPGAVHGLSLLERKVVWTTSPSWLGGTRELVCVGPAGPGFVACQYRQHLFVLDSVDGRVKWRRDDLEPASGLTGDAFFGIIGDEQVLVVFAANCANYTVYDTSTGEELRRGKLDIQLRPVRRTLGRRLFHYTSSEPRSVRVWDPLTDRSVWEQPADAIAETSSLEGVAPGTKVLSFVRDTEEVVYVSRDNRVHIVHLPTGKPLLDLPITPGLMENLSFVRGFRDRERYYINLQHSSVSRPPNAPITSILSDATLPTVHVHGTFLAVDRRTQGLLWQKKVGDRSILHLPDYRLPVLVGLYRIKQEQAEQLSLGIEVLDVNTGELRASRDDLTSDRLLQLAYERDPGTITLRGGKTEIKLEFPTDLARNDPGKAQ